MLSDVDLIAAEDTRHSQRLLQHFNIKTHMQAYHEHNESAATQALLEKLTAGKSIALISDAGTPLIRDPGFRLVQAAKNEDIQVLPIPGACALIAALSASGLASDRFTFEGFLPAKTQARETVLKQLQSDTRTLIFYETPHRIVEAVTDIKNTLGATRKLCVAREITKQFETIKTDTCEAILVWLLENPNEQRGEFVLLIEGNHEDAALDAKARKTVEILAEVLKPAKAASVAAKITGLSKQVLYDYLLSQ